MLTIHRFLEFLPFPLVFIDSFRIKVSKKNRSWTSGANALQSNDVEAEGLMKRKKNE